MIQYTSNFLIYKKLFLSHFFCTIIKTKVLPKNGIRISKFQIEYQKISINILNQKALDHILVYY